MVLESWRRPSGNNMGWFNLKSMLLLSFLTFKLIEWSSYWLPIWDMLSYVMILGASYWFGFVAYRWLKRDYLALKIASYRKAVLITGCDTGFGNMLARNLAPRGFQVLAGCLDPQSSESLKLQAIPNIDVIGLDVTEQYSCEEAFREAALKLEKSQNDLWAVICNAGVCEIGELEWQSFEAIQRVLDVNVMGTIRTVRTFLPMLRKTKGRIVLNASILCNFSSPGFVAYSMSKAAVASLGEGLKRELQVWDIDVCTVQPVLYNTGLLRLDEVKSEFLNEAINKLPENLRQDYGPEYFIGFWNKMSKFVRENANSQPDQAVKMLCHAITTVWPETHYRVGSWKQRIFYNILDFMPIEVVDLCFEKLMRNPVEPNALLKS